MTGAAVPAIEALLRAEIEQPVRPSIAAIADAARAKLPAVAAVLFYGSCLRDDDDTDRVADLYLLVDSYRRAYGPGLAALFNWLLPPNVGYLETHINDQTVRAKYAVMSLRDFEHAAGRWFHPYVWARFAQPGRLPFARDDDVRDRVLRSLTVAVMTLGAAVGPLCVDPNSEEFWISAFRATYASELRAERVGRAREIYTAEQRRYDELFALMRAAGLVHETGQAGRWLARCLWLLRRVQGKILSVARLVKGAFTFHEGATYILWKIERHSGVTIELTPWQRRHPILASTILFWRLYAKGAFK